MQSPVVPPITGKVFAPIPRTEPILCPPGRYYIGDPSIPISKSWLYKDAWAASGYEAPAYFRSEVGYIVLANTYEEDEDRFQGSDYREYVIKSGFLSIINMDFIDLEALTLLEMKQALTGGGGKVQMPITFSSLTEGGHIHTFSQPFVLDFLEHGLFAFLTLEGTPLLVIDTRRQKKGYDADCECDMVCENCARVPVEDTLCIVCGEEYDPQTDKEDYYSEEPNYCLYCSVECEQST